MSEFRIQFKDKDGNLIQNRKATKDFFFRTRGIVDKEFTDYSLAIDAREKGVKIIEYDINEDGINAIVEYL